MAGSSPDSIVNVIYLRTVDVLGEFATQLRAAGLRYSVQRLGADHDAEISISFVQDDDVVDVIEFPITRNGQLVATELEVRDWLRAELPTVFRGRGGTVRQD